MPDPELLDALLEALQQTGSPVRTGELRAGLGWEQGPYAASLSSSIELSTAPAGKRVALEVHQHGLMQQQFHCMEAVG